MSKSENPFTLKTSDEGFNQRKKNVFDQLGVLEKDRRTSFSDENPSHSEDNSEEISSYRSRGADRAYVKLFKGKESIFKKPQNPKPKSFMRGMPDFKKNPHKWTKYSLDDVKDEDMSEKSNTKAALSFLKELEKRKSQETNMDHDGDDNLPAKITFRQSISKDKPMEKPLEEKPNFSSSKLVMPEYVIGQKPKKEKKKKDKVDKGKELKLDHLYEDE